MTFFRPQKILLILLLAAFFSSGCASDGANSRATTSAPPDLDFNGSDCILIRTIRDYTPLDRQHLLVHGPGERSYFLTLSRPAFDMRGSIGFRVDSRDEQLCPFGGDSVIFGAFGGEMISVRSISRLTAEQEELLLARYGKVESVAPETPEQPSDVSGAEVEELG